MIGQTLGHYSIEAQLGEGGMGVVYRARDTHLDRAVAIKVLRPNAVAHPGRRLRFVQEAKAASALRHPNIITVYDIDCDRGTDYIAMEYVEGRSLDHLLRCQRLTPADALKYAIQIAEALAAAHEAGIIHRDLKPGNVMVTGKGAIKLVDFGLAKLIETEPVDESAATRTQTPFTEEGTAIGTLAYMSPEQAQGKKVDARSDLFSFGSLLYEMISGRLPFGASTPAEGLAALLRDEPPPAGAGTDLDRVIARCLEKDPTRRFESAHLLLLALRAIERGKAPDLRPPPKRRLRLAVALPAALLLALLSVACAYWLLVGRDPPISPLAVLPFVHAGTDPNTEYLSEGITETLITNLSHVRNLKVKSRDTVYQYRALGKDVRLVGRELGVRAVLKGRVVQRGDSLAISAELVDTDDGNILWREQYDRRVTDLLVTQQEISHNISGQLRLRLTGEDLQKLAKSPTHDPEAYRLYLLGRYWWNRRTEEALKRSVAYFQQAIQKDPEYALAWVGLADCYQSLGNYSWMPVADAFAKARAAATRAVELDGTLAAAHAALAAQKTLFEWDWPGAEREYRRAIELNPEYGNTHHWYGLHLLALGRVPEALAEIRRARELEPLSPMINANVGYYLYCSRQYEQAVQELRRAVEVDPAFAWTHMSLGRAYTLQNKRDEAAAEFALALSLSRRNLREVAFAACGAAILGQKSEAQRLLDELLGVSRQRYVAPYLPAFVYAALNERDQAFEYFEKAFQERSMAPWLLPDPLLDGIRTDPRFQNLVRRMGLPH
jgi:eukaryotic-like serine/threonine-protein kinase